MSPRPVVRAGPLGFYASCGICGPWRDAPGAAHRDLDQLAPLVAEAEEAGCLFAFLTHAWRVGIDGQPVSDAVGPETRLALTELFRRAA